MSVVRGSSLSGLLLFVGAAAVMSTMLRSIASGFRIPPLPPPSFWGGQPFPEERFYFLCALATCTIIGTVCGAIVSLWRKPGIRRFIFGVVSGCSLGAFAGAYLVSGGNGGMMLVGSIALIAFGLMIRSTARSVERPDHEIEWFLRDDDIARVTREVQDPPNQT